MLSCIQRSHTASFVKEPLLAPEKAEAKGFPARTVYELLNRTFFDRIAFALNGGAMGGVGTIVFLKAIEESVRAQARALSLHDLEDFSLICFLARPEVVLVGCSVGADLGAILKLPRNLDPKTALTWQDLEELCTVLGPNTFTFSLERLLKCYCEGLFDKTPLKDKLLDLLEELTLKDLKGYGAVAFEEEGRVTMMFSEETGFGHLPAYQAALASSSLPCAFDEEVVENKSYTDGSTNGEGVNPTKWAWDLSNLRARAQGRSHLPHETAQSLVINIGAGRYFDDVKPWHQKTWDHVTGGVGACISRHLCAGILRDLELDAVASVRRTDPYTTTVFSEDFPITFPLAHTEEEIQDIRNVAQKVVSEKRHEIDHLAADLLAYALRHPGFKTPVGMEMRRD